MGLCTLHCVMFIWLLKSQLKSDSRLPIPQFYGSRWGTKIIMLLNQAYWLDHTIMEYIIIQSFCRNSYMQKTYLKTKQTSWQSLFCKLIMLLTIPFPSTAAEGELSE